MRLLTAAAARPLARSVLVLPTLACVFVVLSLALAAPAEAQQAPTKTTKRAAATKAARWQRIGTTSSGNPVFIDPKSVSTANGITTATVRVEFLEPVDTPKGKYTSARTVAMFDCAKRLVAVKQNTYFLDEKRNKIGEHKVVGLPGYGTVIKGALPDVAMQHLCAR